MKKLLKFVFFVAIAFMLACCGKSEPRTVAEKSLDCIIKQDYRGCLEYVYVPADKQEEKEALINLVEAMMKSTKGKNALKDKAPESYEFVSEQVDDTQGTATEVFNIKYSNGKTEQEGVKLKKEEDGKWYLEI